MLAFRKPYRKASHRGSILLLVLVAIMIMSLTTSSYLSLMQNEHLAARNSGKRLQAAYLAQSGIAYLREFLAQTQEQIELEGGLLSNPNSLQAILVADDQFDTHRGRFTVFAPDLEQGYYLNFRNGLENESSKINLNALVEEDDETKNTARIRLLALPGMDGSVADAILDFIDEDSQPRELGAEDDYYQELNPAYTTRNGPLSSLDDLLMVRGVTAELLYGLDTNRNYLIDPQEEPRGALLQLDNTLGEFNRGWSAYLTTQSLEKPSDPNGDKRIDVNTGDLKPLHNQLSSVLNVEAANFIVLYRQYGAAAGGSQGSPGSTAPASTVEIDFDQEGKETIDSLLSLVGAQVVDDKTKQTIESPWQDNAGHYRQQFSQLLDYATTDTARRVAGRINIQQAARPVLLSISGMTETIADQILTRRDPGVDLSAGEQRHIVWLLADGILTLEEMRLIWPFVTTGGDVYSGQVVGFFDEGTTQARTRVVLDRTGKNVRLVGWDDLSKLGPGFSLTTLGAQPAELSENPQVVP